MISVKSQKINFYILIAFIIIVADRLTKSWALHLSGEKIINQFLSFSLTFNRGINWGFFNSSNPSVFIFINSAIALVILALAYYTFFCWKLKQPIIGHILILAGAVSNYYDRMFYGGVIDFIVFSWGNWSWPAFNIADSAICVGIGLFILQMGKN
jgi:signal peptidase II